MRHGQHTTLAQGLLRKSLRSFGDGMDARVECGSVSQNELIGFHLRHGAVLRMDGTVAQPHEPVTAVENGTTILCHSTENAYLNLGGNSLRPETTGTQLTLNGTFLCQPYSHDQMAYGNNWNGAAGIALTSAEYAITSCGGNLLFEDPFSSEEVTCGQATPPCPDPPCIEVPDKLSSPANWDAVNVPGSEAESPNQGLPWTAYSTHCPSK